MSISFNSAVNKSAFTILCAAVVDITVVVAAVVFVADNVCRFVVEEISADDDAVDIVADDVDVISVEAVVFAGIEESVVETDVMSVCVEAIVCCEAVVMTVSDVKIETVEEITDEAVFFISAENGGLESPCAEQPVINKANTGSRKPAAFEKRFLFMFNTSVLYW